MRLVSRRIFMGGIGLAGSVALSPTVRALGGVATSRPRSVTRVVSPLETRVGDVFEVRRTFPLDVLSHVDPFLLLDHFDFTIARGQLGGLAPHPHRGFETVTVLFDGAIEHGDSVGNRGIITSGDVQWMTAGRGIVHEENPADVLREKGGRVLGAQLWVNLPARDKMTAPAYQDTAASRIPMVEDGGVRARVIAGHAHGKSAVIGTHTPMVLVDYQLAAGAEIMLPYPENWTAFVHVIDGMLTVGGKRVPPAHLALMAGDGAHMRLKNETQKTCRCLLGGGQPIDEPVARWGPFVMNTRAELQQARADYRSGRMGRVANPTYDRIRHR